MMLKKIIKDAAAIAIGGHIRPDGDCVGSCLGLYQYLTENETEKQVDVYLEEIPDAYAAYVPDGVVRHQIPEGKVYDLFVCLDCGDEERLGFSKALYEQALHTCCIDHHVSNEEFAEYNHIVPDASSTSELVYDLLEYEKISRKTAELLYLGIVHDTGVFQYSCAGQSTFRAAAKLLEKGVDAPKLIQDTYYEKSYAQNQILGRALLESIVFMDGKCIASYITKKTMDFYGVKPKDLDGIVSQMRVTKGVEVAIFMYETDASVYKVSLRSKEKVDVSRIAAYFGGGGHAKAAGFSMAGTPHDVLNNLAGQMEAQLLEEEAEEA